MTTISSNTDRKQQVLTAAVQLFVSKGIQNTSMNEIITASGLSKGGVYHYFESKDDLVLGVLDIFIEIQRNALTLAMAQVGTTRERLETLVKSIAQSDIVHTAGGYSDIRIALDMLTLALEKPLFLARLQAGYDELMALFYPLLKAAFSRVNSRQIPTRERSLLPYRQYLMGYGCNNR